MTGHGIVNGQVQVGLQLKEGANTTKITTLNNAGTINADKFAVVNSGIQNKAVIETLNNSGTIHSKGGSSIAIYNGDDGNGNGSGLDRIGTINNTGTIKSEYTAIGNYGQIDKIDNKTGGTISGQQAIVSATGAIITTLTNSGTIESKNTSAIDNDGTITNLNLEQNSRLISGNSQYLIDNDGTIQNLINKTNLNGANIIIDNAKQIGKIENHSVINGIDKAINHTSRNGVITTLDNKANATISSDNQAINIANSATITTLTNSGTIEGKNGAAINNNGVITTLDNTSRITGAIGIKNDTNSQIGALNNKNHGVIQGDTIAIDNHRDITNLNLEQGSQLIGSDILIQNAGNITELNNNADLKNANKAIVTSNRINKISNHSEITANQIAIETTGTARIDTLTNNKNIIGTDKAINHTAGTIANLNNETGATISGNQAITVSTGANINTLKNVGTIQSHNGAAIDNDGTIQNLNLELNSQLLSTNGALIDNAGTITTLRNNTDLNSDTTAIQNSKDIATLTNNKTISGADNAIEIAANATINTLTNAANAIITGANQAIEIIANATIGTLTNSGTIESRNGAAIDNEGTITNLNLESTSRLVGANNIMIDNKNTITNLTNNSDLSGAIAIKNSSTIDNITNHLTISGTDKAIDHTAGTITTLENKAGAKISGVNQTIAIATGATIENFTNAGDIEGAISIYNNGTIGTLDNSGNISGDIYNTSPNTLRVLKNSGSMGNIYNTATGVMGTDNGDNAIENTNGTASIKSINNAGIIKAKMYAIKNDSGSINDIVNEGKIIFKEKNGAQIYNDGTATAAISKWNIKLNQDAKDYNDFTKIDTTNGNEKIVDERIFVGGNNLNGIKFGKEAIVLTLGPDGGLGEYDLGALVVKQNNGGTDWISAATEVMGVSDDGQYTEQLGITCANLRFDDTGLLVAKCSNNRIDISADLDKSIAADLPSVWVNNYIMSSTIRNSIISDIMMSSIGLLQGDDSGRSDQEEKKEGWHIFAIPYANYSWQSVYGGKAHTYTYGIMSGWAKNLNEYGVIGGFVGYENSDTDMPRRNEIDSNTRYIGGSYYNEFPINSIAHPYVKAVASYTNSNPNIYTKTDSADTYLNTVSAGVAAGLNIYLGKDVIIPEVGIDYNYFKMGSYTLGSERYGRSSLKLPIVNGSLGWQRDYGNNFYTMLKGGVKHLLEDTHETPIKYGIKYNDKYSEKYSGDVKSDMPTTIGTISAGLGYNFNSNTNLTLNYQGGFAKDTRSHTGTAKIEYRF
ncbi:MAG: autotransporter domain-containing protein [Campylobacter sp.]|uniref:autotransporter domain-containing protein n=1 Tax=Campylobacter sp. TaxID=205 RepID=UPI001B0EE509|nr:autotransporter domain-containing protein [Campylobacter sp.]MBO5064057.1 autotransporter domain-containing protein [Campylobacter sp.]